MDEFRNYGIEIPYGRRGGHVKTKCPKCSDSRKNKGDRCLSVDLNKGVWKCHHCDYAGCLKSDPDNTERFKNFKPEIKSYTRPKNFGNPKLSSKAIEYFEGRGISKNTLMDMSIHEALEKMPQTNQLELTLQFPYFEDDELVNIKYRTYDKHFKMSYGSEPIPYNIDSIRESDECVITEGEIDALSFIEAGYKFALSVPSGANKNLSYFDRFVESHFENKSTIYIASDNDEKGDILRNSLIEYFGHDKCRIVKYGDGCKDANDHLIKFGEESLLEILKNSIQVEAKRGRGRPKKESESGQHGNGSGKPPYGNLPFEKPLTNNNHFQILGFKKIDVEEVYVIFCKNSLQVHERSAASITQKTLFPLAPSAWWAAYFPSERSAFNVNAAAEWLIIEAQKKGIVSSDRLRGRGAWLDGENDSDVVIHDGDRLIVNNVPVAIGEYKTKYIYEAGQSLGFEIKAPLSNEEANNFVKLTEYINFEREIDKILFIGWCVIAPVCGALKWRPHLWLTGKRGSGKSWIFREIVRPMLGKTALPLQGETTSAGIRQLVRIDALNPVIDESFKEDSGDISRLQDIISLARLASSEDGGTIAKGTVGQSGRTFTIRGCFAFASVTDTLQQSSDKTRFAVINILERNAPERFAELKRMVPLLMNRENIAKLHSRTLTNLRTIKKNIETFSTAVAQKLGEQRAGDQIGTLLAGAHSLYSTKEITYEYAVEWVEKQNWNLERQNVEETDEDNLLMKILEEKIVVKTYEGVRDRNISELIAIASKIYTDQFINSIYAGDELQRTGIRCEHEMVYFSYNHKSIVKILNGTGYERNYHKILLRITDSESTRAYFAKVRSRAVSIPLEYFKLAEDEVSPAKPIDAELPF